MNTPTTLDVRDYGAVGDGAADDTAGIQRAMDAAAAIRGTVCVPDGVFCCGKLRIPPHVGLIGNASWGYRQPGGSILRLADASAPCLVDLTDAVGATLSGLSLDGAQEGDEVHGVMLRRPDGSFGKEEDSFRIERCNVGGFTGDGVHLDAVWCFSIRGCMLHRNRGSGIWMRGWDGFLLDNWLSANGQAGYAADAENASMTITANRIEWNAGGGIRVAGGSHYNITGNYIDRSGGPAIRLAPRRGQASFTFSITGNVLYRSGRPEWTTDDRDSVHVWLERAHGVVLSGNTLGVGNDDGAGSMSPAYGLRLQGLENCVVKDNAMHKAALKQLVVDLGGHANGVVIQDNVGSLFVDRGQQIWDPDER